MESETALQAAKLLARRLTLLEGLKSQAAKPSIGAATKAVSVTAIVRNFFHHGSFSESKCQIQECSKRLPESVSKRWQAAGFKKTPSSCPIVARKSFGILTHTKLPPIRKVISVASPSSSIA